ncbi:hypothetical protein [uncultured Shimia sp.]|uniref:hypothetical protein n=1 Tax=uncultured Shimia sp. TaxID=573152 RepID=UPI002616CC7F|nr:hypothetical protein [uncultured Shimia sp.]
MVRMLVHAGFHKTGTTSVQRMLAHNKRLLGREAHIVLRKHIMSICENARAFSASRDKLDLLAFTYELSDFLDRYKDGPDKHICISSEDLIGHMPGRRKLTTYDAAPILMKAFVHTVERVMPEPPEMIFYFSTREASSWLTSCHTQHLRAVRMTMTTQEYIDAYADSARLDRIVDMVKIAVKPHRVETAPLERLTKMPLGPLTPILDLLDISPGIRRKLKPLPPANVSVSEDLRNEFLRINQSDLDYDKMRQAKRAARTRWENDLQSQDG